MSAKHTEGPWVVSLGGKQFGSRPRGIHSEGSGLVVVRWNGLARPATKEAEANARLIAAAPDLLRACKAVLEMAVSWQPLTPGDITEVRDAVAKAEGK